MRAAKSAIGSLARFSAEVVLPSAQAGPLDRADSSSKLSSEPPALVAALSAARIQLASAMEALRTVSEAHALEHPPTQAFESSRASEPRDEVEAPLKPIGQLCSAIAHEINNCLQVILTELQKLHSIDASTPALLELRTQAQTLDASLQLAAQACRSVSAFARKAPAGARPSATRGGALGAPGETASRSDATGKPFVRRVLLVDDFPAILRGLARSLRTSGYACTCATCAEEALALLSDDGAPAVDLLVTDIGLPKISGLQLAELVRKSFPALPIILLSGDTSAILDLNRFGGSIAVLAKPFRPRALTDLIESMLKQPTS